MLYDTKCTLLFTFISCVSLTTQIDITPDSSRESRGLFDTVDGIKRDYNSAGSSYFSRFKQNSGLDNLAKVANSAKSKFAELQDSTQSKFAELQDRTQSKLAELQDRTQTGFANAADSLKTSLSRKSAASVTKNTNLVTKQAGESSESGQFGGYVTKIVSGFKLIKGNMKNALVGLHKSVKSSKPEKNVKGYLQGFFGQKASFDKQSSAVASPAAPSFFNILANKLSSNINRQFDDFSRVDNLRADVAVGSFNLFVTAGMSDDLERQISDTQGRIDDAKLRYATANAKATAIMATLSSSVISSGVPLLCAMFTRIAAYDIAFPGINNLRALVSETAPAICHSL